MLKFVERRAREGDLMGNGHMREDLTLSNLGLHLFIY